MTNYVLKAGDALTGTLNGTIINATPNLQENTVNLSAEYLALAGGTMTAGATVIATGNIRAGKFTVGDATYQLLISPPTLTPASSIQTIQQGTGFNQKLTFHKHQEEM